MNNKTRPAVIAATIGRRYALPKHTPPVFEIKEQPPVTFGKLGTILNKLRNGK